MSPLLNHANLGEVQKTAYLTATITEVDSENDTASFTGIGNCPSASDIPIFYHCEKDSEERDNGALEGAAGAFAEDDEVIVMCEIVSSSEYRALRVMGFTDKPKACGFRFKLTRGDGTLITEESELLTYIRLYNSSDESISITAPVYTPVPATGEDVDGYWSFNLADIADADSNGYWVDYSCEDGISTQYPYKYKNDDKDKDADLMPVGAYEDIIPYWNVEFVYDPEPVCISPHPCCIEDPFVIATEGGSRWWLTKTGFSMNKIVKSSVPFKVVYEVKAHYGVQRTGLTCQPTQQAEYTAISDDGLLNFDFVFPVTPICIESGWVSGNVSGFDAKITITIPGFAEDYNCSQMWLASRIRPWEIYVSYEDFDPSPC